MSRAKKSLPIARPFHSVVSRRDDPCSDEIRSIRADVQLALELDKRTKLLETTRPRTASVTPTLNLVLARARDTVQTLTAQLQNNTGENIQIRMLLATIVQTASSLEKATGVSEGKAKHKPLPLDTALWILKGLLPLVHTVIQAKQTLLHPIHRLPLELLTDIFLYAHKSKVDHTNKLLLRRIKSLPSPMIFILGRVSSYWRKVAQSIPGLLLSVIVTYSHLPAWWRDSLVSDAIGRRGIDLFIYMFNLNFHLIIAMKDIQVTWVRSLTVQGYDWASLTSFLQCGPLSRLEELHFTPVDNGHKIIDIPWCLSKTLRTLIVYESLPIFSCTFPKLQKLFIIYPEYRNPQNSHLQSDWRQLATIAPNLETLSLLHRATFPDISALSTTAKDIELDWTTVRSLALLSPVLLKLTAEKMRVTIEDGISYSYTGEDNCWSGGSRCIMERLWNRFFITTGFGHRVQKLVICGHLFCGVWKHKFLQPFTRVRILELEGEVGRPFMNSLSINGGEENVAPDAPDGGRNDGMQEMAVACPNLERLVIRNSDLDGEELMRILSERNNSIWVVQGQARLLKHVEIWNCPRISAEVRRSLRLLRDQGV